MKCPSCDAPKTRVEETRDVGEYVIRVRRCKDKLCGWRVTTEEHYAEMQSIPNKIRKPK
jgi:transcriptional regulator NrdR family protein